MLTRGAGPVWVPAPGPHVRSELVGGCVRSPSSAPALLEVGDLRVWFTRGGREVSAVRGVSYRIDMGETLAIIGESGSGKTASVRALMGLLPPTARVAGSARFEGQELVGLSPVEMRSHRGVDIGMIFQDPARSLNPTMTIGRQIAEAIRTHRSVSRKQLRNEVIELLSRVRLSAPAQRYHEYPHQLSGGMRQRVMIAIALAGRPKLLIADEATTALDVTTQAQIMELLAELQAEFGMAVILISHDLGLAATYADSIIVMYAGVAVERASAVDLFDHVRMPYTSALLRAVPRLDEPPHRERPHIGGRPPDLTHVITGCAFAPRCPDADDDCRTATPAFVEHEPGHWWACIHPLSEAAQ